MDEPRANSHVADPDKRNSTPSNAIHARHTANQAAAATLMPVTSRIIAYVHFVVLNHWTAVPRLIASSV
jgi:hypothetical protein